MGETQDIPANFIEMLTSLGRWLDWAPTLDDMICFDENGSEHANYRLVGHAGTASFLGSWIDLDRDGDQDMWVINDDLIPDTPLIDLVFQNGLFGGTPGELALWDEGCGCLLAHAGMGVGFSDINGDGRWDALITNLIYDGLPDHPDNNMLVQQPRQFHR